MKKKILYIILACALIGLIYFFCNMYIFAKGVQEDSQKNTPKTELSLEKE